MTLGNILGETSNVLSIRNIKEQLLVKTIIEKSNCGKQGMRYNAEWLMECLLLRIKSSAAYHHIRKSGILPLPSKSTIQRILSSMPCTYGFNDEALASIKRSLDSLPLDMRRGSLVWDEMSISKSVKFDSQKLRFEGFVDFGNGNIDEESDSVALADHVLVFIFRPYRSSWVQPIAVFATKGAAPGAIIHRLMIKAIAALEAVGARVTSVTCDGAQPNKSVWKKSGVSGVPDSNGNVKCSMTHPLLENQNIWFLQDVPHLFKCVRNHIFTRRKVAKILPEEKGKDHLETVQTPLEPSKVSRKTGFIEEKIQVSKSFVLYIN